MKLRIPFGKTGLDCEIQDDRLAGVLEHSCMISGGDEQEIVRRAMENTIGSPQLSELARGKKRVLIIASDHTRPVPSRILMPSILEEIRTGSPDAQVRVLMATGFHREPSREELELKFGGLLESLEIWIHDARNVKTMTLKGILPSGGELWINSLVDWADLIVSEGFIEPHFFAGFSGGRKSILPGIVSQETVFANHCSKFITHPNSRAGVIEGNPIHEDMVYAARTVGLAFILNVVIDGEKKVAAAFAGDPFMSHEEGCRFVSHHCEVTRTQADIVITSNGGYPLDQNIYQAVKGMTAAEACVCSGGVIIMCASCSDGHGGKDFYNWFAGKQDPKQVYTRIMEIPQAQTQPDQWEAQILARILCHANVIMVCQEVSRQFVEDMGMRFAPDIEKALLLAETLTDGRKVAVIPDGVGVIVSR